MGVRRVGDHERGYPVGHHELDGWRVLLGAHLADDLPEGLVDGFFDDRAAIPRAL
jgi:hypothetical protein